MHSVVIIDDNSIAVRAIVKSTPWEQLGCIVVGTAFDGVEGLDLLLEKKPEIVITDIKMPGYDGLQMIAQMQNTGVMSKYIIISGYNEFEYARSAIRLGVSDFLLKPIRTKDLVDTLRMIVDSLDDMPTSSLEMDEMEKRLQSINDTVNQCTPLVKDAIAYINQFIHKEMALSQIAEREGVSSAYFSKLFKKETGIGYANYVTMVKMNRAKVLLQNPKNKAYEVAEILGYHDYTYFFQVFKKYYGFAPSNEKFNKNKCI